MQSSLIRDLTQSYPEITALIVLFIGWIAARLIKNLVDRSMGLLDERIARNSTSTEPALTPQIRTFAGAFSFWLVIGVTIVVAMLLLSAEKIELAMHNPLQMLGNLILGSLIVAAGYTLGLLARSAIVRTFPNAAFAQTAARMAQAAIVLVAVVTGLAQLNINTSFVTQLIIVVLATGFTGLALALALGSRSYVANLVNQHELDRFNVGERIRIKEWEGTIVDIRSTGVDLATEEGIVSLPSSLFAENAVLRRISTDE